MPGIDDNPFQNPYEPPQSPPILPPGKPVYDSDALTAVDWIVIVLCSGVGCIIGIFRLIQGKRSGVAMLGFSVLFMFLWAFVRVLLTMAIQAPGR